MTNLFYKTTIIASFNIDEIRFCGSSITRELMINHSLTYTNLQSGIKKAEQFEVKLLKYLCEKLASFAILQTHPRFVQKIKDLDFQHISQFGRNEYERYLNQINGNAKIVFKDEHVEFSKVFDKKILQMFLSSIKSMQFENITRINNKVLLYNTADQKYNEEKHKLTYQEILKKLEFSIKATEI